MHSFWFFFLKKRQFTWLLIASLVGLGVYAVLEIPKESTPEVIVPIGVVVTTYPGTGALDMEELVTNKLEDAAANIDNVDSIISSSRDGVSSITVNFDASADINTSIQDLKDAIAAQESALPRDANDPFVTEVNFADQPILVLSVSSNLHPIAFTELGEDIAEELRSIRGVSAVTVEGTRAPEVQVIVAESALEAYDITIGALTGVLAGANLNVPVGAILTDGVQYSIRFEGNIREVSEIENIPVTSRNGQTIYVRDLATVSDSIARQSTISRVSVDGAPSENAMTISIFKRAGFDVTELSANVTEKVAAMQASGGLLADSQVLVVFDWGEDTWESLRELVRVGFETVFLVMLCLVITIGWRESLVAALSIPLSFVIAFIGLYASGNTINFVSLFALILAIGILVDSGIVITEAIHTRMRTFADPERAAREALREYAWPLIGGTMTTVAVFAPLFFLSGIMGEFIKSIPFTIIFVLLASIFVALGLVPLIAIILTKRGSSNRLEEAQEAYTRKAQAWYRAQLIRFLEHKKAQRLFIWGLVGGLIVALALPMTGFLKVIFFPPEDVDYVFVEIETRRGTGLEETDLAVRAVEEVLYDKPYVEAFTSTVGSGSSFTGSGGQGGNLANITVTLRDDRDEDSAEIAADLRESFAPIKTADVRISELQNGPPTGAPVFIKFFGDNLEELAAVAVRAERILESIDGTRDVAIGSGEQETEFVLEVDRAKASAAGVTPAAIGEVLRTAVFGTTATTITRNGVDVDVTVRLEVDPTANDPAAIPDITIDTIKNLSVPTVSGGSVLLGSVVRERIAPASASIAHEDGERIETVSAFTEGNTVAGEVIAQFQSREAELELPEGVTISYGGETEDINQSFTEMFVALIVGLVLMLAILVLAFNSIRYSLYLLAAVPLSLIGVFGGLALTGQSLSFTSLLGVIALAGVIINHAIILMDSMIHFRRERAEEPLIEVVGDAAVTRLRPIFLTTITTVVGMIPLSTISDFWSPLAFSIMFGLTFAMILTLVLVPTLFYRAEQKKLERAEKLHATNEASA